MQIGTDEVEVEEAMSLCECPPQTKQRRCTCPCPPGEWIPKVCTLEAIQCMLWFDNGLMHVTAVHNEIRDDDRRRSMLTLDQGR